MINDSLWLAGFNFVPCLHFRTNSTKSTICQLKYQFRIMRKVVTTKIQFIIMIFSNPKCLKNIQTHQFLGDRRKWQYQRTNNGKLSCKWFQMLLHFVPEISWLLKDQMELLEAQTLQYFLFFFFKTYFIIYLFFGCVGSQLQHTGSSLMHAGSSLQYTGFSLVVVWGFSLSTCGMQSPGRMDSVVCGTQAL